MHLYRSTSAKIFAILVLFLAIALIVNFLIIKPIALATSGINELINFQGKIVTLSGGINIPDATYNVEFKIYSGGTDTGGGTLDWTEDYLVGGSGGGIAFSSGTFDVGLGSVCSFNGGSCETYTNTDIDWNSYPLYLSVQIGNTSACTVSSNFHADCGGDGEMSPYILLTSTPYAFNSDELDGLTSAAYGQIALNETWSGSNTFQPSANSTALTIQQSSASSPSADILDIDTISGSKVLQITGPTSNEDTISLTSLGSGNGISLNSASSLSLIGNAPSTWDIGNNTLDIQTTNSGPITTGSGLLTVGGDVSVGGSVTVAGGASYSGTGSLSLSSGGANNLSIDTGGAAAIDIGPTNATSIIIGSTTLTTGTITANIANSSTSGFLIQTAGGIPLFTADSSDNQIIIGSASSSPTVLVLGSSNVSSDPTEIDGGMYYNASTDNFRCGVAGVWENCIGGLMLANTSPSSPVNSCTTNCPAFNIYGTLPANYCVASRVIHLEASGVSSTTTTAPKYGAWGVYLGTNATTKSLDTLIGGATPISTTIGISQNNIQWQIDFTMICNMTTSITGEGHFNFVASTTTTTTETMLPMDSASATTGLTTTSSMNIYIFPAWGTSNPANTTTLDQLVVTGS